MRLEKIRWWRRFVVKKYDRSIENTNTLKYKIVTYTEKVGRLFEVKRSGRRRPARGSHHGVEVGPICPPFVPLQRALPHHLVAVA